MKKYTILTAALAAITILLATDAFAHSYNVGKLTVVHPWARASSRAGGVFMTIKNNGNTADKLVAVKGAAAKNISVHQTIMENNIMKMRPVKALEIPAGGEVTLKPGGYHVMMMGLLKPLVKGEKFPLTLVFEKAGEVKVEIKIEKAGAMKSMGMDHSMKMDGHNPCSMKHNPCSMKHNPCSMKMDNHNN